MSVSEISQISIKQLLHNLYSDTYLIDTIRDTYFPRDKSILKPNGTVSGFNPSKMQMLLKSVRKSEFADSVADIHCRQNFNLDND